MLAVQLGQLTADGEAGQLLQEQAAFASAPQAQLAHELLVSGFLAGRAGNPGEQFTVGHRLRVQPALLRRAGPQSGPAGGASKKFLATYYNCAIKMLQRAA